MTTATLQIDMDVLDELFNNQKKLDDILLFDDDFLFGSSTSTQNGSSKINDVASKKETLSLSSEDKLDNIKSRSIGMIVVPLILEVIAIYYAVKYFT